MKRVWSKRSGKCLIQVDESIKVCGENPLSPVLLDSGSGAMRLGGVWLRELRRKPILLRESFVGDG